MSAVREVARSVEGLVQICNESCQDEHLLKELSKAAAEVTRTLNQLLNHIKSVSSSNFLSKLIFDASLSS